MKIVGIDPGFSGALAVLDGGEVVAVEDLPVQYVKNTSGKLRGEYVESRLVQLIDLHRISHVFLEKQGSMPDQSAQSTFSTGFGFGLIRGVLSALRIPYELVHPVTWKKAMLEGLGRNKSHSLAKARALFPTADLGRRKDAGRAEALLIACYGRRLLNGGLTKVPAQV